MAEVSHTESLRLQVERVKKFLVSEAVSDAVWHQSFSDQCHG